MPELTPRCRSPILLRGPNAHLSAILLRALKVALRRTRTSKHDAAVCGRGECGVVMTRAESVERKCRFDGRRNAASCTRACHFVPRAFGVIERVRDTRVCISGSFTRKEPDATTCGRFRVTGHCATPSPATVTIMPSITSVGR